VVATWERTWRAHAQIRLSAPVDQSGEFAQLFELADQFAAGQLPEARVRPAIGNALRSIGVPAVD
jgi:hypothetical protein